MSTELSPFAPPAPGAVRAAPPPGVPTLPPTPSAPLPAPTPTLPQVAPPPQSPTTPTVSAPIAGSGQTTPGGRAPKRSRTPIVVLAGLTLATIAGAAWFALADGNADDTPSVVETEPPVGLDIAPQDVSSPIVVPIDDASDVIAEIDENTAEAEALDILGLDETGNEIPDIESVVGYRFTWNSESAETMTITVDATTDNYVLAAGDEAAWREVDGRSYSSIDGSEWLEVEGDTPAAMRPFGVDAPVRIEQVLDPITTEYTASTISELDDGTTVLTAEIDAYAYSEGHPNEGLDWISLMGHPADGAAVQPGDVVSIQAEIAADGTTIELMTVTASDFATSYSLDEVFETAPVIASPEL